MAVVSTAPVLRLSDEFLAQYVGRQPEWGFDGLGYIVYLRTYSRRKDDGTQEEWWETVRRAVEGNFNIEVQRLHELGKLTPERLAELQREMERFYDLAFNLIVTPPGRGLWMSGTEYEKRTGDALNNCWLVACRPQNFDGEEVPSPAFAPCFVFDQAMKGGGVGVNIQRRNTDLMPPVQNTVDLTVVCREDHPDRAEMEPLGVVFRQPVEAERNGRYVRVADSRQGWCGALRAVIESAFDGAQSLIIDVSDVRPRGSLIRGFGGIASGPTPLVQMLQRVNAILNRHVGRKLSPTAWGDIIQNIGVCVVSGNVRRTALILIGDQDDKEFIESKNYAIEGNREASQWRWASNNSIVVSSTTPREVLREIARNIYYNGEPGYVNLEVAQNYGRIVDGLQPGIDAEVEGFNPCGEIGLPNGSPCNLVEINLPRIQQWINEGKADDSLYEEAARLAARYAYRVTFRPYEWEVTRNVVARHRRLGVSITGFTDWVILRFGERAVLGFDDQGNPIYNLKVAAFLDNLYRVVRAANAEQAEELEAIQSIKVTTVKPSGTLSLLMGVSPGQHFHWSPYMIRRVRFAANHPLIPVLQECGYPMEPAITGWTDSGEPIYDHHTLVVEFPIRATTADHPMFQSAGDVPLEEQVAIQALLQTYWADNAVSATLSFRRPERKDPEAEAAVIEQITDVLDRYKGILKSTTILPYASDTYPQMPIEAITRKEYERRVAQIRKRPWEVLAHQQTVTAEVDDLDTNLECAAGACPIR